MLFHTWTFFVYFAVVYPVFLIVRNTPLRTPWLFLASYTFYGWWNPYCLILIAYSTFVDYVAVKRMQSGDSKKLWLAISVVNNFGMLGFFKYAGFVVDNVNALLAWFQTGHTVSMPEVVLPVGVSFFVFQSMSYTIDYYRGQVEPARSFIHYTTFVSFFPQLVAGPIERASNLLPQLSAKSIITRQNISDGLSLFVVGLFKKVVMADYLAQYVDKVYAAPDSFDAPALALATFAFGWQIYFDFSGYTDMARGIASLMGFRLMLNFRNPYLATDLGDFWSRWHISLSTWFRDYVYIPLGGGRGGAFNTYRNILLTMLLSGLWHGAAWTFILWGALHAAGRMLTRELERTPFYRDRVPTFAKQLFVFAFVTFTWIFFRARDLDQAWTVVTRMFTTSWSSDPQFPIVALTLIMSGWIYEYVYESKGRPLLEFAAVRVAVVTFMMMCVAFLAASGEQAFIYFQF
ncbi:MAG: MBOAT family protein [Candidatus Hydrogenedentes bacterium]|nr:MBOAT family protein [Candidatus Hydrogenedentota bacterium]